MIIYPYSNTAFCQTYTAADSDPVTGAGTATTTVGPLNANANVNTMKLSACVVTVQSLANSNVNGALYMCYSEGGSGLFPVA